MVLKHVLPLKVEGDAMNEQEFEREFGVSLDGCAILTNLSHRVLHYERYENARSYVARLDKFDPLLIKSLFGSNQNAELILQHQIEHFNSVIHTVKVKKGSIIEFEEKDKKSPLLAMIGVSQSGIKIRPDDDVFSWSDRVYEEKPGIMDDFAITSAHREEWLGRSFEAFRYRVKESKKVLILNLLQMVAVIAMYIVFSNDKANPYHDFITFTLTFAFFLGVVAIGFSISSRFILLKYEEDGEIL